jgi:hypothetical protein
MRRAELILRLKHFIGKKSWRRETTLVGFLVGMDGSLDYPDAEHLLARLVETNDGVDWFLPPRIEEDEDKRASTPLRYRLTSKGKRQVQRWLRTKKN